MEPLLIHEALTVRFSFWLAGRVQEGLACLNELYCYLIHYSLEQRQQAYALAWSLAQRQVKVVMSTSGAGYTVWVQLQAAELQRATELLELLQP